MSEVSRFASVAHSPAIDSLTEETIAPIEPADFTHAYHWGVLKSGFEALLERHIHSRADLERWIADVGDFYAAQYEAESLVEWKAQTDEDDAVGLQELDAYIRENIDPIRQQAFYHIYCSLLGSPFVEELPVSPYAPLLKYAQEQVALFSVPGMTLQRQEIWLQDKLQQWYDSIDSQVSEDEQDPAVLFSELIATAQSGTNREKFDTILSALVANRLEGARIHSEPIQTFFLKKEGFTGITSEAWSQFHDEFERWMVPFVTELTEEMEEDHGTVPAVGESEGWGIPYDEDQVWHPIRVLSKAAEIFDRISPLAGTRFKEMVSRGEIYLNPDPPDVVEAGAYEFLVEGRPRIVGGVQGTHRDFSDLCHEAGHAFYGIAATSQPLVWHRVPRNDINELVATAFELIGSEHFDVIFDTDEAQEAQRELIEGYLFQLTDWFQRSTFTIALHQDPIPGGSDLEQLWEQSIDRFQPFKDWTDLEDKKSLGYLVDEATHLPPAFRTRYMLGTPAAIDVWLQYRSDPSGTIERLESVMESGSSIEPEEIYRVLNIENPTNSGYFERLTRKIRQVFEEL